MLSVGELIDKRFPETETFDRILKTIYTFRQEWIEKANQKCQRDEKTFHKV